jgi:ectoine hydroxylase-related dioxygenase (phytanoyl-CoA dioxygenase family)
MNRHPLNPVTEQDIKNYQEDGVACIRNVFDQEWVDLLLQPVNRYLEGDTLGLLPTAPQRQPFRTCPEVRKYTLESPLAEVCGKILQSKEIRYFMEEYFIKEPNSTEKTIWHADRAGWPVSGAMVPSVWVALSPITRENSLEFIATSHRHDVLYWLFSPNAKQMIQPPDRPNHPDGESLRDHPDARYLTFDMNPGDLLIFHPWMLHYAPGNPTPTHRIAISTRVFGDDIRWDPRPDCLNVAGLSFDEMIPGEKPMGGAFPLIWSEDGRTESAENFPWGFATTWTDEGAEKIKKNTTQINSRGFSEMLEKSGGPTPLPYYPFGEKQKKSVGVK